MAITQSPSFEQTTGIPFDTSDFTMLSYGSTFAFGSTQSSTMDEWENDEDLLEADSGFEDDAIEESNDNDNDNDKKFDQYLFGEDDD